MNCDWEEFAAKFMNPKRTRYVVNLHGVRRPRARRDLVEIAVFIAQDSASACG